MCGGSNYSSAHFLIELLSMFDAVYCEYSAFRVSIKCYFQDSLRHWSDLPYQFASFCTNHNTTPPTAACTVFFAADVVIRWLFNPIIVLFMGSSCMILCSWIARIRGPLSSNRWPSSSLFSTVLMVLTFSVPLLVALWQDRTEFLFSVACLRVDPSIVRRPSRGL